MIPILDQKRRLVGIVTSTEAINRLHSHISRQANRGGDRPTQFRIHERLPLRPVAEIPPEAATEKAFVLLYWQAPMYRNGNPLGYSFGFAVFDGGDKDLDDMFAKSDEVLDLRHNPGIDIGKSTPKRPGQ